MKVLGKIVLAVLILAVVAVAGVYVYLSSDPYKNLYDDYKTYRKDKFVITDYLSYDKETTDLSLSVNKSFMYTVIDVDQIIEDVESQYDVKVEAVGYQLVDNTNEINVFIKAKYMNLIPVHLKAEGTFTYDKFTVTVNLKDIKVGSKITLDQKFLSEKLGVESFEYTYTLDDGDIRNILDSTRFDPDLFELTPVKDNELTLKVNVRDYAMKSIQKLVDSIDDHRIKTIFFESNGTIENAAVRLLEVFIKNILKTIE